MGGTPIGQEDAALATGVSHDAPEEGTDQVATSLDEAAEIVSLVDLVAQRASQRQFPYVKPIALKSSEAVEEAELILQFVRRTEVVQLQSFLDQKYVTYLQSCPAEASMSEAARRLTYAMEFYYNHVYEFLCGETLRVRSFRHHFETGRFVPLVSPQCFRHKRRRAQQQRVWATS